MDANQQHTTTFTNVNNTWSTSLEKMERDHERDGNIILQAQDHHQIPMDSSGIWQNNYHHLLQIPISSSSSNNIVPSSCSSSGFLSDILGIRIEEDEEPEEELGAMKEMMYKIAVMQPVDIDPSTIRKPKRRNVRISDDPQSVAARHRRERISEKIRILQRLVPGGTKMDTASMLDEAIRYVKFLKRQIRLLQSTPQHTPQPPQCIGVAATATTTATTTSTLFLASAGCSDWPFAPNILHSSAAAVATSSMDMPGRLGFNQACDGSSSFNHHEVISE